jgi:hypothetical protein
MNAETEQPVTCHPSVRRWIYLRGMLIGLMVGAWWIFFAPDDLMEPGLKRILGVVAGLIATGSYLFNLRQTLCPSKSTPTVAEDK